MPRKTKKKNYTYAVGRRKSASARIRLYKGKGENLVNGMPIGKYFPGKRLASLWQEPFDLTDTLGKYYITARVVGGGKKGQLEAVIHGTARSLAEVSSDLRLPLKKAGLLTRDDRVRERRKIGTGGKARRKKQSPKR